MTENVNYEDNLFYLSRTIDLLDNGVKLNLDRDLFYKKTMELLVFTDETLQSIFADLTENSYLINRNLYLHSLMKKKKKFINTLYRYLKKEKSEWPLDDKDRARLQRALEVHQADIGDIRGTLSLSDDREEDREIISRNEMNFLMAPGLLDEEEE
ncbi:MAG: hypothetical protein PQJ59_18265 [Spirochaetales bacterium]|nr:hypothetical protein [Spirochaetales bacterium]